MVACVAYVVAPPWGHYVSSCLLARSGCVGQFIKPCYPPLPPRLLLKLIWCCVLHWHRISPPPGSADDKIDDTGEKTPSSLNGCLPKSVGLTWWDGALQYTDIASHPLLAARTTRSTKRARRTPSSRALSATATLSVCPECPLSLGGSRLLHLRSPALREVVGNRWSADRQAGGRAP